MVRCAVSGKREHNYELSQIKGKRENERTISERKKQKDTERKSETEGDKK